MRGGGGGGGGGLRSPTGAGRGAMSPRRRRALARLGILLLLAGLIWSTQPNKRLGARRQRAQRTASLDPALKVNLWTLRMKMRYHEPYTA